jgi:hypothetical protein
MREEKSGWPRRLLLLSGLAIGAAAIQGTSVFAGDGGDDSDLNDNDNGNDPVQLSFATVGDSRQDPVSPDASTLPVSAQDKIWLENTKAWSRIMRSIQTQRAKLLFFNGDMIMGYGKTEVPSDTTTVDKIVKSDLVATYRQYAFWRGMVTSLLETGTYVVPVAGNHETQWKAGGKIALVSNENAWRANMGDLILDDDRFQDMFGEKPTSEVVTDTSGPDGLSSNQQQLTYSFDFHGSHFSIINTDPVGNDAHAPYKWLTTDLADAKARGNTHFFVFGHKPAFTYYFGKNTTLPATPSGLDVPADKTGRDAFWALMEQYGATYFCGHEHIFNLMQPLAATGGTAWQVLVGSGGSPFEAAPNAVTIAPSDRYYAWAKVDVRKSGKVRITAYGFDDNFGQTHKLQQILLSH